MPDSASCRAFQSRNRISLLPAPVRTRSQRRYFASSCNILRTARWTSATNVSRSAVVGYTNAGKSTLVSRLTKQPLVARDRLFETLDPTLRRMHLPGGAQDPELSCRFDHVIVHIASCGTAAACTSPAVRHVLSLCLVAIDTDDFGLWLCSLPVAVHHARKPAAAAWLTLFAHASLCAAARVTAPAWPAERRAC